MRTSATPTAACTPAIRRSCARPWRPPRRAANPNRASSRKTRDPTRRPGAATAAGVALSARQRFDTFVAAPAGALAQLQALAAGEGATLYLSGPAGAGKSHLALATCAQAEAGGRRAAYLPLRAAAGGLRAALEALAASVVALDGLEAIAGG